jgi:hypothetical protein
MACQLDILPALHWTQDSSRFLQSNCSSFLHGFQTGVKGLERQLNMPSSHLSPKSKLVISRTTPKNWSKAPYSISFPLFFCRMLLVRRRMYFNVLGAKAAISDPVQNVSNHCLWWTGPISQRPHQQLWGWWKSSSHTIEELVSYALWSTRHTFGGSMVPTW